MRTISVVVHTHLFCSWIAHLYILCRTWKQFFLYSKMKRKKIKNEEKKMKIKKRGLDFVTFCENWIWRCWSLEWLSCLILTYFPIGPLFPLVLFSHLSICSTRCPQPHYNLEKSFWSWFACVLVWLLVLEACQVCLMFIF